MWKFITAAFLFVLVLAGALTYKFFRDGQNEEKNRNTAQQQKGTISLALDAYAGYYPLRSDQMVTDMLSKGYRLALNLDEGDYAARIDMLEKGKIDLAVFTVDSFILNGMKNDFPGTIIAVLSESNGADAIVARADVASTLDDLKENKDLRISYTPKSPSEHLLKVVGSHFGVDRFLEGPRRPVRRGAGWLCGILRTRVAPETGSGRRHEAVRSLGGALPIRPGPSP